MVFLFYVVTNFYSDSPAIFNYELNVHFKEIVHFDTGGFLPSNSHITDNRVVTFCSIL